MGEGGLWSRGGATVVSVGPEAKTHCTLASGMEGGERTLRGEICYFKEVDTMKM